MWETPTRERKEANKWGRHPSPRPGWQTPCAPEKEFHKIFSLWNLPTFRHEEFIRLLSFITAGTRWLWGLTASLSHLQECSPPRWQKENFWRASSRPRWSCQGSSDRALLERNSATRSDFSCPSPQEFEFADLGKSSPPPYAAPPSRALLSLFVASWGRLEVEICLYKSIHQFSPEMLICWRKLHISCHWHCLLLLHSLPGEQDVIKKRKIFSATCKLCSRPGSYKS